MCQYQTRDLKDAEQQYETSHIVLFHVKTLHQLLLLLPISHPHPPAAKKQTIADRIRSSLLDLPHGREGLTGAVFTAGVEVYLQRETAALAFSQGPTGLIHTYIHHTYRSVLTYLRRLSTKQQQYLVYTLNICINLLNGWYFKAISWEIQQKGSFCFSPLILVFIQTS